MALTAEVNFRELAAQPSVQSEWTQKQICRAFQDLSNRSSFPEIECPVAAPRRETLSNFFRSNLPPIQLFFLIGNNGFRGLAAFDVTGPPNKTRRDSISI
jgi:hypothetical protein